MSLHVRGSFQDEEKHEEREDGSRLEGKGMFIGRVAEISPDIQRRFNEVTWGLVLVGRERI